MAKNDDKSTKTSKGFFRPEQDQVQKILEKVREVSKTNISSAQYIKERILAKDQFFDRQRGFFNLGDGQVEKGLTGTQHAKIFQLASEQALSSFAPEDRDLLSSVLGSKDGKGFATLGSNTQVDILEQALREGKQSKLLVQLVNRTRRSIRPTARHIATHYGADANKAHRLDGLFPSTLGVSIPMGSNDAKPISSRDLDDTLKQSLRSIRDADKPFAAQLEIYFKEISKMKPGSGIHKKFSLKSNESANTALGRQTGQYHLQFKYDNRDITLKLPVIAGNNAKIGYTGANLNVRRIMTPVAIVDTGSEKMTYSIMQRNEYFMRRFNQEVLPLMLEGKISGRELRAHITELNSNVFNGQQATSGRAFTPRQNFAQMRYEQEMGAGVQLVTNQTGGLMRGNIPLAYSSLGDSDKVKFLNLWSSEFGVDVSENKFAEQGIVSSKTGRKFAGKSLVGDLAAYEFADPRVTEHARLDQKIRKRTMAPESVIASYKGGGVSQREYQDYGNRQLRRKIQSWGSRWGTSQPEIARLQKITSNKRLNFDDLDSIKALFAQNKKGDFATLTAAINGFSSRADTSTMRLAYNQKFLSPQEQSLYGMTSSNSNTGVSFSKLDNKSMLPGNERMWEELKRGNRLGAARDLIGDLQQKIINHKEFSAHTGIEKQAWANEMLGKVNLQVINDAGFLLGSSERLPYAKKQNMKALTSMIVNHMGVENSSAFLAETPEDHINRVRGQLARREEILQVGTMYVDPEKMKNRPTRFFGSGEGIMRKRMTHLLSQEVGMNKTLARLNPEAFQLTGDAKIVNGEFVSGGFAKENGNYILKEKNLKMRNSIMAWDSNGREVIYDKKMRNMQFTEMAANDGSSNKWLLMEFDELIRPESHVKLHGDIKQGVSFVGGGVKGWMKVAIDLSNMMVSAIGAKQLASAGGNQRIENITEMQFKHGRRPHQHIRQIATAMNLTMTDMEMNNQMVRNPFEFTKNNLSLNSDFEGDRKTAHKAQVQKMLDWYASQAKANKGLLQEERFAGIFGLTGSVFKGHNEAKEMVEKAFEGFDKNVVGRLVSASNSGSAFGVARQFLGDEMSMQGAGKQGTLEGRSMMTMMGKAFGLRGEEMTTDFLKRMKSQDLSAEGPEKWAVRDEMQKSMRTIMNQEKLPSNAAIIDLTEKPDSVETIKRMREQGKNALITGQEVWLKTGDNKGIYLPTSSIPGMAEKTITTMSGDIKASAVLRNAYNTFVSDIAGGVNPQSAMGDLQDELFPHTTEFSKLGMGGVLKGSLPGSRRLVATSASDAGQHMPQANVVGISEKHAQRMVREMVDSNVYNPEEVARLESSLNKLKGGGTIGGVLARHPFIGAYSIQKTLFKLIDDPGDVIVIPEVNVDVNINGKANRLKLGAMLGLAGDYDFDNVIAAFVDPESERVIASEMDFKKGSQYYENYMHHQIRFQAMQLREGPASGEILNNMEDAAGKMQVKQAYTGRLSNEMTFLKFAAASYLPEERAAAVFGLAEWLEQKPISSKHLNPRQLGVSMEKLVTTFEQSISSPTALRNTLSEFIDVGSTGEIHLSMDDVKKIKEDTGYQLKTNHMKGGKVVIQGFDLKQLSQDIFDAKVKATKFGLREDVSSLKGATRGSAAARSHQKLWGASRSGIGKAASMGDQIAANMMGASGQSAILNHKGVAAAMAIGSLVGLSTVLSQPKEMIGTGKHLDTRVKMNMTKGTKRITGGSVKPPRAPIGIPTGPGMLSQRRAMIAPNPVGKNHYIVRARAQYPEDIALISQQLQQFTSMGNSVNISLRDSRDSRNSYFESNKKY